MEIMEPTVKADKWIKAAKVEDFPRDGGACVKYGDKQIAVFNFTRMGRWFATQNMCPHKKEMALYRGMIGTEEKEECEIPKVACPFHKKTFSLESGECLNSGEEALVTYPVKVEDGVVYVGVPEEKDE